MSPRISIRPLCLVVIAVAASLPAAENRESPGEAVARGFAGTYRFNDVFAEEGIPYFDQAGHLQRVEVVELSDEEGRRVSFYNVVDDEKSLHFAYVIRGGGEELTLEELDAEGEQRFHCVGRYQPESGLFECTAKGSPKPARDLNRPWTRALGPFRRPTSWPAYETLDRHNFFRFYEWGFVYLQENVKNDAEGKAVARETGIITAVEAGKKFDETR